MAKRKNESKSLFESECSKQQRFSNEPSAKHVDTTKVSKKFERADVKWFPRVELEDVCHLEAHNQAIHKTDCSDSESFCEDEASKLILSNRTFKNKARSRKQNGRFKKELLNVTPKCENVTNTSENDNNLTVDLSLKKSIAVGSTIKYYSKLIDYISKSAEVTDTVLDSENGEVEKDFEISTNEEKKNSYRHSTIAKPSLLVIENNRKLIEKLAICQGKNKSEKNEASSNKALQASKVSNKEEDFDKYTRDQARSRKRNDRFKVENDKHILSDSDKEESFESNRNSTHHSSVDSRSGKQIIDRNDDEINYFTDSDNEDESTILKRRAIRAKNPIRIWNYKANLSPLKLNFDKMKIVESDEKELDRLHDEIFNTKKGKKFLKVVGNTQLPTFFHGSVSEFKAAHYPSDTFSIFDPLNQR